MEYPNRLGLTLTAGLYVLAGCDIDRAVERIEDATTRIEDYAQELLAKKYENGVTELFAERCDGDKHCLKLVADQLSSCAQRATAQIRELSNRSDIDEDLDKLARFRTGYWIRNCIVSKLGFPLLYEIEMASNWGGGPFISNSDIEKLGVWHDSIPTEVGGTLSVDGILGWDWQRVVRKNQVSTPSFEANVSAVWVVGGKKRGVIAEIHEAGHWLDGMWMVVFARSGEVFEPSTNSVLYMMRVGSEKPVLIDGSWPAFVEPPTFSGFSRVSVSNK